MKASLIYFLQYMVGDQKYTKHVLAYDQEDLAKTVNDNPDHFKEFREHRASIYQMSHPVIGTRIFFNDDGIEVDEEHSDVVLTVGEECFARLELTERPN